MIKIKTNLRYIPKNNNELLEIDCKTFPSIKLLK